MLDWGREVCGDLAAAERREWLCTNGLGGFASGTVAGLADPALPRAPGRRARSRRWAAPCSSPSSTRTSSTTAAPVRARRQPLGRRQRRAPRLPGPRALPPRRHHAGVDLRAAATRSSRSASGWSPAPTPPTSRYRAAPRRRARDARRSRALVNYRDYHATTRGRAGWRMAVEPVAGRPPRAPPSTGARPCVVLAPGARGARRRTPGTSGFALAARARARASTRATTTCTSAPSAPRSSRAAR